MRCDMPSPTGNNYDDDDRFPRRKRRKDNPFDEFLNNFMNNFGAGFDFENIFDFLFSDSYNVNRIQEIILP